jgi:hypothetical protein
MRIPMMVTTTSNSTNVNPPRRGPEFRSVPPADLPEARIEAMHTSAAESLK